MLIATLGGAETTIDMNMFFRRGLRLIGSTLRSRTPEMKARILREMENLLWAKIADGRLRPVVYRTLPMSTHAEEAHAILERDKNIGKVVLTVNR